MMSKKKPSNGDQPATQHDLSLLAGEMAERFDKVDARFDKVETRLDNVETRLDRLESGQAAILELVQGIDQQLKEWRHIPAKVERLHDKIFPHG